MIPKRKIYIVFVTIFALLDFLSIAFLGTSNQLIPQNGKSIVPKPKLVVQLGHSLPALQTKFISDGKYLITSGVDRKIILWDVYSGRQIRTFQINTGMSIHGLSFLQKTNELLIAGMDGTLRRINIKTGEEIYIHNDNSQGISALATTNDNHFAVTIEGFGNLTYWDIEQNQKIRSFTIKKKNINHPIAAIMSLVYPGLTLSPNGKFLGIGTIDGSIEIWNLKKGKKLKSFNGYFDTSGKLTFSNDSKTLILLDYKGIKGKFPIHEPPCIIEDSESKPVKILERYVAKLLSRYKEFSSFDEYSKELALCYLKNYWHLLDSPNISNEVIEKYPELIMLILGSKSMHKKEKEYWATMINQMNADHKSELTKIIYNEMKYLIEGHNLLDKTVVFHPRERLDNITETVFSSDDSIILNAFKNGEWQFINQTSLEKRKIKPKFSGRIIPLIFSPQNREVIGYTPGGDLLMINTKNGIISRKFAGQSLPAKTIHFNNNDSQILIGMKGDQDFEKFIALTQPMVSLKDIKNRFIEKEPWWALWSIQSGHQMGFRVEKNTNGWAGNFPAKKDIFLKLMRKDPYKDLYNKILKKRFENYFREFIDYNILFVSNEEQYKKIKYAESLWLKGEVMEALKKIKEGLIDVLTKKQKLAFDDVELTLEKIKNFTSLFHSMLGAINLSGGAMSSDTLKIGLTEESNIKLVHFGHFFSGLIQNSTSEHFKDQNKAIQLAVRGGERSIKTLRGHKEEVICLSFTPNDDILLSCDKVGKLKFWDVETGNLIESLKIEPRGKIFKTLFSPDGNRIALIINNNQIMVLNRKSKRKIFEFMVKENLLNDATCFNISGNNNHLIFGFPDGRCILFDANTGKEHCSLFSFTDGTWVTVDPEGRFDTNNLEDIKGLHWIMPDSPMKPWALETFMRDYYEPKLMVRILNEETFPPIPPLESRNRVQPMVKIKSIKSSPQSQGRVTIKVDVGKASSKYGGKNWNTDVYDLRVFRDRQLVGYTPGRKNKIDVDPVSGTKTISFTNIKLPRKYGIKEVEFSAYAFNKDRVKSQTDRVPFTIPHQLKPRKGNAYVVSIGVDQYQNPKLNLNFAVNDAVMMNKVLTEKLNATGEYTNVIPVLLISDKTKKSAVKKNIKAIFDLLSGKEGRDVLLTGIANIEKLRPANPEDFILISFSCHGFNSSSAFYLMPHDSGEVYDGHDKKKKADRLKQSISSDELSEWLRDVDAGDMVMLIDACYSASAVEREGFKPGPMGDKGLGQLAYNKGMKILAATQADSLALESDSLKHGFFNVCIGSRRARIRPG